MPAYPWRRVRSVTRGSWRRAYVDPELDGPNIHHQIANATAPRRKKFERRNTPDRARHPSCHRPPRRRPASPLPPRRPHGRPRRGSPLPSSRDRNRPVPGARSVTGNPRRRRKRHCRVIPRHASGHSSEIVPIIPGNFRPCHIRRHPDDIRISVEIDARNTDRIGSVRRRPILFRRSPRATSHPARRSRSVYSTVASPGIRRHGAGGYQGPPGARRGAPTIVDAIGIVLPCRMPRRATSPRGNVPARTVAPARRDIGPGGGAGLRPRMAQCSTSDARRSGMVRKSSRERSRHYRGRLSAIGRESASERAFIGRGGGAGSVGSSSDHLIIIFGD